jgi:UDP-N-acetyl-D-galactosamine dehydrogenase
MRIGVIGLGYVGLPLARSLSRKYKVVGYDISPERISYIVDSSDQNQILYTDNEEDLNGVDVFIVTVPTPVNKKNLPDMSPLENASRLIGNHLSSNSIVIYESTVYPGATEEFCVPILESISELVLNKDFSVAYSPERIDPGNKVNTLENTVKLISASNEKALKIVHDIYSSVVTNASLHICESIKVCEAAKAVENIQRDVNIALMNELSIIFNHLDIPTRAVIDAAATKWNFGKYHPGLVGGHCIGVDPYYVIYKANAVGVDAKLIRSSREINDGMVEYSLSRILSDIKTIKKLNEIEDLKILFMGITFKENCDDCRNSQPLKLAKKLHIYNKNITIYDPWVENFSSESFETLKKMPSDFSVFDVVIKAVNHKDFANLKNNINSDNLIFFDLTNSLNSDGFSLH